MPGAHVAAMTVVAMTIAAVHASIIAVSEVMPTGLTSSMLGLQPTELVVELLVLLLL